MLPGGWLRHSFVTMVMVRGVNITDLANRDFARAEHEAEASILVDHRHEADWYCGAIQKRRKQQNRDPHPPLSMPLKAPPHERHFTSVPGARRR